MQATKARLGFLKLSAELRNKIYELVLIAEEPIRIDRMNMLQFGRGPALFEVSKQVRIEALSIFYGGNEFCFSMNKHIDQTRFQSTSEPKAWIRRLGPEKAGLIKSLTLNVVGLRWSKSMSPKEAAEHLIELFASKYNLSKLGGSSISDTLLEILAGNGLSKKAVKVVYQHRRKGQTEVDLLDPAVVA